MGANIKINYKIMSTKTENTQGTRVEALTYQIDVRNDLDKIKAENALNNAYKAQIKAEKIETQIANFDLKNVIERLEKLVTFRTPESDKTTAAHWYAKNVKEYRSPLFIFNQICKGGEKNPYNNPKENFKVHEISTKKYTGITMLSFLPLNLFLSQISMQGNYSPFMLKTAFNEAMKQKAFELKDTTKAAVIKGAILNEAVKDYSSQKITLSKFIDTIAPYYTQKEWNDEKTVKMLSTLVITAEIEAEKEAKKK